MRWRPSRGLCRSGSRCDAWEDGRHLRGAQGGPEGQGAVARAALQHSYAAVRGDCERGHGRACGSAEHPGLKRGAFLICNELIFFLEGMRSDGGQ